MPQMYSLQQLRDLIIQYENEKKVVEQKIKYFQDLFKQSQKTGFVTIR
jgi:hypothetical protein